MAVTILSSMISGGFYVCSPRSHSSARMGSNNVTVHRNHRKIAREHKSFSQFSIPLNGSSRCSWPPRHQQHSSGKGRVERMVVFTSGANTLLCKLYRTNAPGNTLLGPQDPEMDAVSSSHPSILLMSWGSWLAQRPGRAPVQVAAQG